MHLCVSPRHIMENEVQMYYCKDCSTVDTDAEFHSYDLAKHLRKHHGVDIHTTSYISDSHGHSWYCFSCNSKSRKNHRSFDSDQALFDHLRTVHGLHIT